MKKERFIGSGMKHANNSKRGKNTIAVNNSAKTLLFTTIIINYNSIYYKKGAKVRLNNYRKNKNVIKKKYLIYNCKM